MTTAEEWRHCHRDEANIAYDVNQPSNLKVAFIFPRQKVAKFKTSRSKQPRATYVCGISISLIPTLDSFYSLIESTVLFWRSFRSGTWHQSVTRYQMTLGISIINFLSKERKLRRKVIELFTNFKQSQEATTYNG